jgi:hypothetical protein
MLRRYLKDPIELFMPTDILYALFKAFTEEKQVIGHKFVSLDEQKGGGFSDSV